MASKKAGVQPSGSNKIRFVMLEADLSDGNLAELTQAISNALKPVAPQVRYITPPASKGLNGNGDHEDEGEDFIGGEVGEVEAAPPMPASKAPKGPSKPKKSKQPDFVELDWTGTGGPTLKEFAKQKAPKSRQSQYLTAALWLKEYGGNPTVTTDKIYSCFKTVGWSVAFTDWGQPFHNLVHSDHMRKVGTGEFAITTLGEGALEIAGE